MRFGALLALLPLAAACQHDPYAHLYTTKEPASADLVGVYGCEADAVRTTWGESWGELPSWVELRADGTFEATHLPDRDAELRRDVSGTWRVGTLGGNEHTLFWGVYFEVADGGQASAHLFGERSPYGLIFRRRDPDLGQAVLLDRRDM